MRDELSYRPAVWFWMVIAVALGWNALGVAAFVVHITQAPTSPLPAWYTVAFAIAVFAGTLGCILLLMRRRWAVWVFVVSLIGIVVQQAYHVMASDIGRALEPRHLALSALVLAVAIALIWLARLVARRGWLD